jgi:hypothetical protein
MLHNNFGVLMYCAHIGVLRLLWLCTLILPSPQVIISHPGSYDPALLDSIASALSKAGLLERCGDLYQSLGRLQEALQAYRKGHAYRYLPQHPKLQDLYTHCMIVRHRCRCYARMVQTALQLDRL